MTLYILSYETVASGFLPPQEQEETEQSLSQAYPQAMMDYFKDVEGDLAYQHKRGTYKNRRFYPYRDPNGKSWVIGYGQTITQPEYEQYKEHGMPEEDADRLLNRSLMKAEQEAARHFGRRGWGAMKPEQRRAAIDFAFNLGGTGMKDYKKWSRAIRTGDWHTAAKESKRSYKDPSTGRMKPLDKRNRRYLETFIHPYMQR